jgi:hypothetical protein
VGASWSEGIVVGTDLSKNARFSYVGRVNVADLLSQASCDIGKIRADMTSVERRMNIRILKSFDNSVIKLSGKKFYVKNARNPLGSSRSLETIRDLQSDSGIKGTARPTHSSVLRNDEIPACKSTEGLRKLVRLNLLGFKDSG